MKYVVTYEVWIGGRLSYRSQRDVTSTSLRLDRPDEARRIAADLIRAQIFIAPGSRIVVTDIRPA